MNNRTIPMISGVTLILICALGALLRFYNLGAQGLARWDEGMYLLDSLNLDYININAKPFHLILVRLGLETFGVEEYAGQLVSAALGVMTLFLAFLTGRKLYTPATGLIFAALIAVSYNHVYFSRLTHAQSDSTFFMTVSVLSLVYHWRGSRASSWRMVLSGFALGLSFTCHPNVVAMVIYLSSFVTILSVVKFYHTRDISAFKDMLLFGASAAVPLLIIESGSLLAGIRTYFESAVYHAKMSAASGESVKSDYLYYYRQAIKWEGMGKAALAIPSFTVIALLAIRGVKRGGADLFTLGLALFPLFFWSVDQSLGSTDRHYTHMLIGVDFAIARAVVWLGSTFASAIKNSDRARMAIFVLPCALVLWLIADYGQFNLAKDYKFITTRSRYGKIMDALDSLAGKSPVAVSALAPPPIHFSLYKDQRLLFANSLDEAKGYYDKGLVRYMYHRRSNNKVYPKYGFYMTELDNQLSLGGSITPKIRLSGDIIYDLAETLHHPDTEKFLKRKSLITPLSEHVESAFMPWVERTRQLGLVE